MALRLGNGPQGIVGDRKLGGVEVDALDGVGNCLGKIAVGIEHCEAPFIVQNHVLEKGALPGAGFADDIFVHSTPHHPRGRPCLEPVLRCNVASCERMSRPTTLYRGSASKKNSQEHNIQFVKKGDREREGSRATSFVALFCSA
jgi:hypothetical protein